MVALYSFSIVSYNSSVSPRNLNIHPCLYIAESPEKAKLSAMEHIMKEYPNDNVLDVGKIVEVPQNIIDDIKELL